MQIRSLLFKFLKLMSNFYSWKYFSLDNIYITISVVNFEGYVRLATRSPRQLNENCSEVYNYVHTIK